MPYDHTKYRPFTPIQKADRRWPSQSITKAPLWCAVDLRDGNQALVKPMSVGQKKRLFSLLVACGFKHIEIGFPAASQPDFEFCRALIEENLIPDDVTIQVLTQARSELIERTFTALQGASKAILHVYNSTSTVQRERVFSKDRQGIKQIAVDGARKVQQEAANYPDTEWTFQYSPESFTGTELDFAVEVIDAVNDVWRPDLGQAVIVNLPATVEMAMPNIFADQVEWVCDQIKLRSHVQISLHTHNDRGCAVAAAELGVLAGADRIEGTLLGNGERTGNMDLVTMAMNLYSQGIDPELDLSDMAAIVETVEACTEISVHPRHPYAGELVFTAFSGSHQDAIRKCLKIQQPNAPWQVAYLPIDPRDLGRQYEEVIRINSQSGKGGVAYVLERDYNLSLPRWLQIDFARRVQKATEDSAGEIDSFSIRRLFERAYIDTPHGWEMTSYDLHREGQAVDIDLRFVADSQQAPIQARSGGALEALVGGLSKRFHQAIIIETYDEFALSEGTDSLALACIRVRVGEKVSIGVARAEDTTSACLQAALTAAGKALEDVLASQAITAQAIS